MAQYLRRESIKAAAQRLIDSRARDGLVHFLLFKRALVRAGTHDVAFSSNDDNFTGAMRDLAGTYPTGTHLVAPAGFRPFVKVFGTAGAEKYVSARWTTNGPADALSGPRWSSVVQIQGSRPRRGSFKPDYQSHLQSLLLKTGNQMPGLTDAAIWYHRADDLEARFGAMADTAQLEDRVRESFSAQLGLNAAELAALFDVDARPSNRQSPPMSCSIQWPARRNISPTLVAAAVTCAKWWPRLRFWPTGRQWDCASAIHYCCASALLSARSVSSSSPVSPVRGKRSSLKRLPAGSRPPLRKASPPPTR